MTFQFKTLKDNLELKQVILAAFPGYRKHKAYSTEFRSVRINSYWDGGSRSEFALVHLPTMKVKPLPTSTHPFYEVSGRGIVGQNNIIEVDHVGNITLKVLPPDYALVEAGICCGKPATAVVYYGQPLAIEGAHEPLQIPEEL